LAGPGAAAGDVERAQGLGLPAATWHLLTSREKFDTAGGLVPGGGDATSHVAWN
jgi:hypothetical protein